MHFTHQPIGWGNRKLFLANKDQIYNYLLLPHLALICKCQFLAWRLNCITQYKIWWHKYIALGNEISILKHPPSQPHRSQWACSHSLHITATTNIWESHHRKAVYNQGTHTEPLQLKAPKTEATRSSTPYVKCILFRWWLQKWLQKSQTSPLHNISTQQICTCTP